MGLARGEIRPLTGLRGIAAVLVVLFHGFQGNDFATPLHNLLLHGYLCVELFFVMSGFVMCLSYERMFEDGLSWTRYGGFLARRLGRIYPLYAVMLAATLAAAAAGIIASPFPAPSDLFCNVLLVQSWGLADSIVLPAWSISTELGAYLLFPVLLPLVRRGTAAPVAAAAMGLLVALALRSGWLFHQTDPAAPWRIVPPGMGPLSLDPLLRCLGGFVLGMVAYRLFQAAGTGSRAGAWGRAGDVAAVLAVALFCVPDTDLLLMPVFVVLVVSLAAGNSLAGRLLGFGPVHWLGTISYSIYLVHHLLLISLQEPLQHALERLHVPHAYSMAPVLVLLAVIPVAALSYTLVERPGRDAARWLLGFRRTALATEPSAP